MWAGFGLTVKLKQETIVYMRRVGIYVVVLALVATLSLETLTHNVLAKPGTETPVDRIRANCNIIQPNLQRIHTSDALMRVNIGQEYNGISVRLMARLNSRLALNRIDGTKFTEIASRFDSEREYFSDNYKEYEASLSSLLKINCNTNPTEFYSGLIVTRDARHKLSVSVKSMNDSLAEYRVAVEELQQEMFGKDKKRAN